MKRILFSIMFLVGVLSPGIFFTNSLVFAQTTPQDQFNLTVAVENPLCDKDGNNCKTNIKDILSSILKAIVEIALPIVIVMVIYSGFLYVMARGKPEAIEKAHKTLTWTLIGAAVLLGAQLIATVLVDTISNIAKDSGANTKTVSNSLSNSGSNVGSGVNNVNNNLAPSNSNLSNSGGNLTSNNSGVVVENSSNSSNLNNNTAVVNNSVSVGSSGSNALTPVTTTKYYVNAPSGANLRSEPNLTSSYKTQPYGTVLDVSGENNGFYVIYNSTGTTVLGYISKPLLTQGTKAPALNTGGSSSGTGSSGNFTSITKDAINPNPYTSNLYFEKASEKSGSITGKFSFTVNKNFTPYNGLLYLQCKLIGGNGDFANNILQNNSNKNLTTGEITTPTYTITGAGKHACIMYHFKDGSSGKVYVTNETSVVVK